MKDKISSLNVKDIFSNFMWEFTKDTSFHEIVTSVDLSESYFVTGEPCITLMTSGHRVSKAKIYVESNKIVSLNALDMKNVFHTWSLTPDLSRALNHTPELKIEFNTIVNLVQNMLDLISGYRESIDCIEFISMNPVIYNDARNFKIKGSFGQGTSVVDINYNMHVLKPVQCLNALALRDDYMEYGIEQKYGKRLYASGTIKNMLLVKY